MCQISRGKKSKGQEMRPKWVPRVSKKLRELMDARDWSQEDVMRKASSEVSTKTVSNVLRGKDGTPDYTPRGDSVRALFSAFGQDGVNALREVGLPEWAGMLEQELDDIKLDAIIRQLRENPDLKKLLDDAL